MQIVLQELDKIAIKHVRKEIPVMYQPVNYSNYLLQLIPE